MFAASLVVKNTFICVVEDEEPLSPVGTRGRAKTTDVASLGRQLAHGPVEEEERAEEEEMRKCCSAPATEDAAHRVASLVAGLDAGGTAAFAAFSEIRRSVRTLALDSAGCSLVLRALEVARTAEAQALAASFRGWVGEAVHSTFACRVLEQIVHRCRTADSAFIAEELLTQGPAALALRASGSSILRCLIEFSYEDIRTQALVDAVLSADVAVLCSHKYGHAVAMSILSNGSSAQRGSILSALRSDVQRFARQRFASQVFEHALAFCPDEERICLASAVLMRPGTVVALACHNFGVNIVRSLLDMPTVSMQVRMVLMKSSGRISRDKFGSGLMREIGCSKQQSKRVLDLTQELGLEERAEYMAAVTSVAIGGA